MWDSRWALWLCACPPCSVTVLLEFFTAASTFLLFYRAHGGKGYPQKPLFPPQPHGWLLASAAQTMRILTVWWNQPKKAGD